MFVGIDISKHKLDVALGKNGEFFSIPYNDQQIHSLIQKLLKIKPKIILLESTGGLENKLVHLLLQYKLPVVIVNSRHIRNFAKAIGRLAKTDRIDASVLAHFAEAIQPEIRPILDEQAQQLKALIRRRKQIVKMINAENNRLLQAPNTLAQDIKEHIQFLKSQLKKIDSDINKHISLHEKWKKYPENITKCPWNRCCHFYQYHR